MIDRIELDAEVAALEDFGCQQSRARPAEWIEYQVACFGERFNERLDRRNRLLSGVQLVARIRHVDDIRDWLLR